MKVSRRVGHFLTDEDEREFPLTFEPAGHIDPLVIENDDGTVTVRYAVQDDDAMDYEWDLMDVTFELFSSGDQRNDWIRRNLEECEDCGYSSEDHTDTVRADAEADGYGSIPCDQWTPAVTWTDRMFWVERYEHGLVNYAIGQESSAVDRQWDVSPGVAVLTVPDDAGPADDPDRFANFARAVLEEYTSWCNGDVYGIVEETFTLEGDEWTEVDDRHDACWGFIGGDYAKQTVKEGL